MAYKVVTFDVYSALGDIEGTFVPQLLQLDACKRVDVASMFAMWRSKQYEYMMIHNCIQEPFVSFADITRRALDYTLHTYDVVLDEQTKEKLVNDWSHIQFRDGAREVIMAVQQKGYATGMLSNGDSDMLHALQTKLNVKFDYIFSAEQAGYFKPRPELYEYACQKANIKKAELLHVAGSMPDIIGSIYAGVSSAWSNVNNERLLVPNKEPTYNVANLSKLITDVLV